MKNLSLTFSILFLSFSFVSYARSISFSDSNSKQMLTSTQSDYSLQYTNASDQVEYRIQVLASSREFEPTPSKFKGLSNVSYYFDGGLYKYTYGSTYSFAEAEQIQRAVSEKYPQCFIVQFKDGRRIDSETLNQQPLAYAQSQAVYSQPQNINQNVVKNQTESNNSVGMVVPSPQEQIAHQVSDVPEYRVLFLTTARDIPLSSGKFSGIKDVSSYQDNGSFNYTSGECASYADAESILTKLSSRYPDASIVKFRNGMPARMNDFQQGDQPQSETSGGVSYVVPSPQEQIAHQVSDVLEYRVLFLTTAQDIPLSSSKFSGIKDVSSYQDNGMFNYTSGECASYAAAQTIEEKLIKRYPQSTIIMFKGNQRVY